jgi:hypothetical protein
VTFVAMALAIVGMLLSAWAVEGTLELPPVLIFGLAAAGGIALGFRMYADAILGDAGQPSPARAAPAAAT